MQRNLIAGARTRAFAAAPALAASVEPAPQAAAKK
jgi:hypothetical protein